MRDHLVAVDIGTASARAGVFDLSGRLIARESRPILLHRPDSLRAEHGSEDIWSAVTTSVRAAMDQAGIAKDRVAAIGFDATCSLVVTGPDGITINPSEPTIKGLDTISWMDHRALAEAEFLTSLGGQVIDRVGGTLSPEMALPKLLWLKRHRPDLWESTTGIFDLADYMSYRATGSRSRSVSTLASKWGFSAGGDGGWPLDFLEKAGLADLRQIARLPEGATALGTCIGTLTEEAATALGLDRACRVAPGMIDAYAGALGLMGALDPADRPDRAALVAGTSTCLIAMHPSEKGGFRSLWGPFADVAMTGQWLVEGGQSSAGSLLDHVVRMHAAGGTPDATRHGRIMARIAEGMATEGPGYGLPIHVLPDFHGNRSPAADPLATGMIAGLTLDTSFDGLCRLYWRTAVGLACSLRHILETLAAAGTRPRELCLGGGHAQNPLLVQLYSDMTGLRIVVPEMKEAILLGTAINAATAGGLFGSMSEAARALTGPVRPVEPDATRSPWHDRDYKRYLRMLQARADVLGDA